MLTLAAAFLPFAVVSAFTPGPNNLLLAASGANFGVRRTIPHVLGIVSGFPLLVLAVGLGLGTWAGFRMTGLMVSPLTVTATGEQVVPPFILTTSWQLMLPTYAALVAIFLATQVALNRSISRMDLVGIASMRY